MSRVHHHPRPNSSELAKINDKEGECIGAPPELKRTRQNQCRARGWGDRTELPVHSRFSLMCKLMVPQAFRGPRVQCREGRAFKRCGNQIVSHAFRDPRVLQFQGGLSINVKFNAFSRLPRTASSSISGRVIKRCFMRQHLKIINDGGCCRPARISTNSPKSMSSKELG